MPRPCAPVCVRHRLRVRGLVQGVGFRPFVSRLAAAAQLDGHVHNDGDGVHIEVQGSPGALAAFARALVEQAPPAARVDGVATEVLAPRSGRGFAIRPSPAGGPRTALVSPDLPTCADCLAELRDPADRRHRHPFITCTACGPRFTIVTAVPYDRARTTMAGFAMCADCRREYEDPADRRFHAEPIACPACGPRLDLPLDAATGTLRDGGILAVKGIGGWHLACRADDEAAVARLRARKHREAKPLAVMSADAHTLGVIDGVEDALLHGPAAPIVLVRRRPGASLAPSVAGPSPWIGLLVPYTPVHHLLCGDLGVPLVMTSGNRGEEPIAVGDEEARTRLAGIADAFLGHDRPIHRRCEDSVVRAGFPVRRSRGYAPVALRLPVRAPEPIVAAGGDLKSAFCVVRGAEAFASPHLGDLHTPAAVAAFASDLELYLDMLGVRPAAVACDLHPDYRSTRWAREQGLPVVAVQHHHAHAAACLAEHGETGPALAIVLDGTGWGTDGTVWGGEVLRCDLRAFARVAHLEAVPMPGGEAAVREPWRMAGAYLERAGRPVPWERWALVRQSLAVNGPRSSGTGRLFDAVAALLGVRETVTYEAQAAIELEALAGDTAAAPYPCARRDGVIAGADLVAAAHDDLAAGRDRREIAAAFHEGVAAAFADACMAAGDETTIALSGGSFQNLRLLAATRRRLEAAGRRVLVPIRVPPGDGGLAVGQAAVAAARLSACASASPDR